MPQIAPLSWGLLMIASMRCVTVCGRAVAHAANTIARSGSNLRKRHPLQRRRRLEIVMHGREDALEIGVRKTRPQPLRDGVRLHASAVVASEGIGFNVAQTLLSVRL